MEDSKMYSKKRRDFIDVLVSMNQNEINDYIKTHGKSPKPIQLYRLIESCKDNDLKPIEEQYKFIYGR